MSVTQQQVVDYIKGISVLELSQLVKALETELGVSAAAAMPMGMPMMAGGGGAAAATSKSPFSKSVLSPACTVNTSAWLPGSARPGARTL